MPCILKKQTEVSPGIIAFTHNEVLNGPIRSSLRVKNILNNLHKNGQWIFGVHIQGDCSYMRKWPIEQWQSFFMWPNPNANFLSNVPKKKIIDLNCINLMPVFNTRSKQKKWDICIVSRPSPIKRMTESLKIVKNVLLLRKDTKVIFIVPDPRNLELGNKLYRDDSVDKNFFELPLKIFTPKELKNISFLCSSTRSFGFFPVSEELISSLIGESKFVMLTSHYEGTPRVLGESLLNGTPCIVSKKLHSGVNNYLNKSNCVFLEDDHEVAAKQIIQALASYYRFKISIKKTQQIFGARKNTKKLQYFLKSILESEGYTVDGDWCLEDLQFRLPGHGRKFNYQFMDDDLALINWLKAARNVDPLDEEIFYSLSKSKNTNRFRGQSIRSRFISAVGSIYLRMVSLK